MRKSNAIKIAAAALFLLVAGITAGCNKYVYDDLEYCPRGIYVKLYDKTECAGEATYRNYTNITLMAFNEQGTLSSIKNYPNYSGDKREELFIPTPQPGSYEVAAWAGLDEHFIVEHLKINKSSKDDVFATIRSKNAMAVELGDHQVFATQKYKPIRIGAEQEFFVHDSLNMRELTNRVNVRVVGFEHPENYEIQLLSDNGKYDAQANMLHDLQLRYPSKMKLVPNEKYPNENDLFGKFTTMKFRSGYSNILVIKNLKKDTEALKTDLVGVILMSDYAKNINLNCLNDFDVKVNVKKCNCPDGYTAVSIYVNDWLVHTYDTDLGE